MYIRRTQIRSNATGEHYYTFRLVRTERIDGKVKQATLLNLGRYFPIAPEEWPVLCRRIDELLAGQASLLDSELSKPAALEADRMAALLLAADAKPALAQTASESEAGVVPATPAEVHAIDVASIELVRPRSIGVEHVGLAAMGLVYLVAD